MAGVQFSHLGLCFLLIHAREHASYLYAATAVSFAGALWVGCFGLESAVARSGKIFWRYNWEGACCVAFVTPLRLGSQLVVLAVTVMTALQRSSSDGDDDDGDDAEADDSSSSSSSWKNVLYAMAALSVLAAAAAVVVRRAAQALSLIHI